MLVPAPDATPASNDACALCVGAPVAGPKLRKNSSSAFARFGAEVIAGLAEGEEEGKGERDGFAEVVADAVEGKGDDLGADDGPPKLSRKSRSPCPTVTGCASLAVGAGAWLADPAEGVGVLPDDP